jgi:hypothetical protein
MYYSIPKLIEFGLVIKKLKLNLPEEEIKEICAKIDSNQDNKISLAGILIFLTIKF